MSIGWIRNLFVAELMAVAVPLAPGFEFVSENGTLKTTFAARLDRPFSGQSGPG